MGALAAVESPAAVLSTLGDWPSWTLNRQMAGRYFAILTEAGPGAGSAVLCACEEKGDPDQPLEAKLAWFALIPWTISVTQKGQTAFMTLTCPDWSVHGVSTRAWHIRLSVPQQSLPWIRRVREYGLWQNGTVSLLGWKARFDD